MAKGNTERNSGVIFGGCGSAKQGDFVYNILTCILQEYNKSEQPHSRSAGMNDYDKGGIFPEKGQ